MNRSLLFKARSWLLLTSVVVCIGSGGLLFTRCNGTKPLFARYHTPHIAMGIYHTCVLTRAGEVKCWGDGSEGILGNGTTNIIGDDETLVGLQAVDVGPEDVAQLESGAEFACVRFVNGTVRCWGRNSVGQLGIGNTSNIGDNELASASPLVSLSAPAKQIALGQSHACALLETGGVQCWGANDKGQLGLGHTNTIGDNEVPSSQAPLDFGSDPVVRIASRFEHTCAIFASHRLKCWGENNVGELGYGNTNVIGDNETAPLVGYVDVGGDVVDVATGMFGTCVILKGTDSRGDSLKCWGLSNVAGQGNPANIGDTEAPSSIPALYFSKPVVSLGLGASEACVVLTDRNVVCWGANWQGEMGEGSTTASGNTSVVTSRSAVSIGQGVDELSFSVEIAGPAVCSIVDEFKVKCWGLCDGKCGYGASLQIGDNEFPSSVSPIDVGL